MMSYSGHPQSCITIDRTQGACFTTYVQVRGPTFLTMPQCHMRANKHNEDRPDFLNGTGRLKRRQRTVRFPVGGEPTEA